MTTVLMVLGLLMAASVLLGVWGLAGDSRMWWKTSIGCLGALGCAEVVLYALYLFGAHLGSQDGI